MEDFDKKYDVRRCDRCCANCRHGDAEYDGMATCYHPDRPLKDNGNHEKYNASIDDVCNAWVPKDDKCKPLRNCDIAKDWLHDLYCHFRPPKGMREMPPEWVDAISAFCKWLVAPAETQQEKEVN